MAKFLQVTLLLPIIVCLLFLNQFSIAQLQQNVAQQVTTTNNSLISATNLTTSPTTTTTTTESILKSALNSAITNATHLNDETKRFQNFKESPYYVPPFEAEILSIPENQITFVRAMTTKDLELFRQILREAIEKRNSFAPSVSLMLKYTGKLLGVLIKNRHEEQKVKPRVEPKPEFFEMIASLGEDVINKSNVIKKKKGYSKRTVDVVDLYNRVDEVFKQIEKTIYASPVAAYLKWNEMNLTGSGISLIDEASDLVAQFRGMGYENCIFVAKRIVNLVRMFARGLIPSVKDV